MIILALSLILNLVLGIMYFVDRPSGNIHIIVPAYSPGVAESKYTASIDLSYAGTKLYAYAVEWEAQDQYGNELSKVGENCKQIDTISSQDNEKKAHCDFQLKVKGIYTISGTLIYAQEVLEGSNEEKFDLLQSIGKRNYFEFPPINVEEEINVSSQNSIEI